MAFFRCGVDKPGRILVCSTSTANRTTSWTANSFADEPAYDPDSSYITAAWDTKVFHVNSDGDLVVDRPISSVYIGISAMRGVTSSGTAVYSGIAIYKNGVSIAAVMGNSNVANATSKTFNLSFAVGDVISVKTKTSSTSQAYCRVGYCIAQGD